MSNPTSNFNWQMPTASDLVTDLPADFEVFGQAVDTSLADLKGGTTGQVLSKATNADMDFTWVTSDDANAIQNSIVDAKGDLVAASANDTPARLAVGANGEMLVADSTAATGLDWKSADEQYPWTAYTPTLSSITLGNGTLAGLYQQIGKTVNVIILLTLGSTSSVATFPRFSLPVTSATSTVPIYGNVNLIDTGTQFYFGVVAYENTTTVQIYAQDTALATSQRTFIGGTTPFTWATGDVMSLTFSYKAV